MKEIEKRALFWGGLTAMAGLSMLTMAWSIFPLGGATLPHHVEQLFPISFHSSAFFVALLCGFLSTGTMGFTLLSPEVAKKERYHRPGTTSGA